MQRPLGERGRAAASKLPDLTWVCSEQAAKPTNAPIERIEQVVHPTDTRRASLWALNDASAKAADYRKANCSAEEALTPPGRVTAMAQRLNAMLEAIKIVQPALESFYGGPTDGFNQLGVPADLIRGHRSSPASSGRSVERLRRSALPYHAA